MTCSKCGAMNDSGRSKHRSFTKLGKLWCGHCGSLLRRTK